MRKIIADYVELTDEWVGTPDVVMYTSETADGYEIYILGWTDKNGHVKNMDNEENVFMYKENLLDILVDDFLSFNEEFIFMKKDDLIDVLVGDYIAGYSSMLEVYVSDDLIKEVIDELEFLLLPEEEYEDEDRKYDEYKDDKLTI